MKFLIVLSGVLATVTHANAMSGFEKKLTEAVQVYRKALETENKLSCHDRKSKDSIKFRCVYLEDVRYGVVVEATIEDNELEMDTEPFYVEGERSMGAAFGTRGSNEEAFDQFLSHIRTKVLEKGNCGEPDPSSVRVSNKTWDTITCMGITGKTLNIKRTIKDELEGNLFEGGWYDIGTYFSTIRVSRE